MFDNYYIPFTSKSGLPLYSPLPQNQTSSPSLLFSKILLLTSSTANTSKPVFSFCFHPHSKNSAITF